MSQPELFVVCKNCGSEVSPYVTECPYCGQRVRKRAPKIDRGGPEAEPKPKRRRAALPRLRAGEIEGIAPDTRPYATFGLIAVSLVATLVWVAAPLTLDEIGVLIVPGFEEPWRWFTAPFVHASNLGYQFVALVAVAVFGSMIERRFGWFPVVFVFLAAGAGGIGSGGCPRSARALRPDVRGAWRQRRGPRPALRVARGRPAGCATRARNATTT